MAFTHRPPPYLTMPHERVREQLDKDLPILYNAHGALDSTAIKAVQQGAGFAFASGNLQITGSKTGISTGLTTVQNVTASINNGATPTNVWVTATITPSNKSTIDIYVWKPTAAGDTTPIAATSPVTVHWTATGTATTTG